MTDSEQLAEVKGLTQHIVTDLKGLKGDVDKIKRDLDKIKGDVEGLKLETIRTNDRVEIYQQSSQQVVNLAFGLIVATTAAIILPAILAR